MNGTPVKRCEIVARDALDRFDRTFTSAGMLGAVQLLEKFPADNRPRTLLTAPDALDGLELGQFDSRNFERRLAQPPSKNLEPAIQILAEHVDGGRPVLPSHRHIDIDRILLEFLIDLLGGSSATSTGAHD